MRTLPKIIGVAGLVISSFSLLLASIPCFGYYALAPGLIGVVACLIALLQLKNQQESYVVPMTGFLIGAAATAVACYQYYRMQTIIGDTIDVIQNKTKEKAKEILVREVKEIIEDKLQDNDSIPEKKTHRAK
ncbi:MAG: hypothetical protein K0R65_1008 [Crocinitomicaceae bacterium]|jgi:ABC-type enterochelin transport system permease subunit|nr:hypothetical protein [Crocinitomicaceae bacterium]